MPAIERAVHAETGRLQASSFRKVGSRSRGRNPRITLHYPIIPVVTRPPINDNEQSFRSVPGEGLARNCAVQHLGGAPVSRSWVLGFRVSGLGVYSATKSRATWRKPQAPIRRPPPASKVRKPPSPTRFNLCDYSGSRWAAQASWSNGLRPEGLRVRLPDATSSVSTEPYNPTLRDAHFCFIPAGQTEAEEKITRLPCAFAGVVR